MDSIKSFFKKTPGRVIAISFFLVILLGSFLLALPISHRGGVSVGYLDALFTATSATCVTGLVTVDTATAFSGFGQLIILLLIQVGGFGVAVLGTCVTLLAGRFVGLRERRIIKESWNIDSMAGLVKLLRAVLLLTLSVEATGALLSFFFFKSRIDGPRSVWVSLFHSVSSFNNAGFDLLGDMKSLTDYSASFYINLVTCFLIIVGGIGYLAVFDVLHKRSFRRLSLQTKAVLVTSAGLIAVGALLLMLSDRFTPLEAFFQSVSARTAGFASVDLSVISGGGMFLLCCLMFVGASPGSTGGGIKTTTLFVMLVAFRSAATNRNKEAFRRKISAENVIKAFIVAFSGLLMIILSTLALNLLEPELPFKSLMFEAISAFATVGLSLGITPGLSDGAKLVLIATMYFGRIGPLTVASLWAFRPDTGNSFTEEQITIG